MKLCSILKPFIMITATVRFHRMRVTCKILYLKPEDDGPNEAERQTRVSVDDVLSADGLQPDLNV